MPADPFISEDQFQFAEAVYFQELYAMRVSMFQKGFPEAAQSFGDLTPSRKTVHEFWTRWARGV